MDELARAFAARAERLRKPPPPPREPRSPYSPEYRRPERRTPLTYRDPTGSAAVGNLTKKEKGKKR